MHRLSYQYILPPGIANGISVLPDVNTDAGDARNRLLVQVLESRHDNIMKHSTAPEAWQAWIAYTVAEESTNEKALADQGYLINPGSA